MDFENDMNQSAMSPNLDWQNMQNAPLPKPNDSTKKAMWVVLGLFVVLVVIVCTIVAVICMNRSSDSANNIDNNDEDVVEAVEMSAFKKMTKAEAMDFLKYGHGATADLPENYVGEEIVNSTIMSGNAIVSELRLIYSHDTIEELRQMVEMKYGGHSTIAITENDYEIKEYDYYVIVTPNRIKGATSCDHGYYSDCDSLLSFKRSYLDYFRKETAPNSYNDVYYLNTRDPEVVEYLLRVCTFFSNVGFYGGHGNIYSHSFEEQDDKFVFTVYYIGAGLNLEKLKNGDDGVEYAINLFLRRYAVDKSDGKMYTVQIGDGTMESVKSFPVTKEELSSLLGK